MSKLTFINVGSGSSGNASFISYKNTLLQIDMGLPKKRIIEALNRVHKTIEDIDAIFITHNHADHIKDLSLYHNSIAIYGDKKSLLDHDVYQINPFESFQIKDIKITALKTCHDAPNPMGFLFEMDDKTLCYLTDTGVLPKKTASLIHNCDVYVFESNHDVDMLMDSSRPLCLKKRILSKIGHLSNVQSATYLSNLIGDKTKAIFLAHLSEECNTPTIAIKEHTERYNKVGLFTERLKICALKPKENTIYEN